MRDIALPKSECSNPVLFPVSVSEYHDEIHETEKLSFRSAEELL